MQKEHVAKLLDGSTVTLRLLNKGDLEALKKFFKSLSKKSRQFLYDDVSDPAVIEGWINNLNYNFVLPLVAVADGEIIADATLHKRSYGPSRHVGRIRIVVREDYLGKGLGTILINEITMFAKAKKLAYLSSTLAEKGEKVAIEAMRNSGFKEVTRIPRFLMDLDGNYDDAVVLIKTL